MNVLLVGCGGREHAIAKKLSESKFLRRLYCFGSYKNPAIEELTYAYYKGTRYDELRPRIEKEQIDYAVIGPESFLADGFVDKLTKDGIQCIGPFFPEIETDKYRCKKLLKEYNIQEGKFRYFESYEIIDAYKYIQSLDYEYVIKPNGLTGGKGVQVMGEHFTTHEQALEYMRTLDSFLIEEKYKGEEFSLMSFCDGKNIKHMPLARDFKRLLEGNKGPNTGGMGCITGKDGLLPGINENDRDKAEIINERVYRAINNITGRPYVGVLFGGFMKTNEEIMVLEYNARFGDPECINILAILKTDLCEIFDAILKSKLNELKIEFNLEPSVSKYLVPQGYPHTTENIKIDCNHDCIVAGVGEDHMCTGSRAICFVEIGEDASNKIEERIKSLNTTLVHRKDIGCGESYVKAGVDANKNEELIKNIKPFLPQTGEFSGSFPFGNEVLMTTIDGVGTKTVVAQVCENYSNLGKDIVNHCTNDLLVAGGIPLFMTDYVGSSSIDVKLTTDIIKDIAFACENVGCKLIGGETAEMPSIYQRDKLDILGNMVGVRKFTFRGVQLGDIVIGIKSSGLHTNGYSLVRRVLSNKDIRENEDALLAPHRCYLDLYRKIKDLPIGAICHITGGGLIDNPKRVVPKNLCVSFGKDDLKIFQQDIFDLIQKKGRLEDEEMWRTFNCGVGLLIIVNEKCVSSILNILGEGKVIGKIIERSNEPVIFV